MYQSDAGIFTTTLTRFTDANSQADAHIEAPEHRGNWLCGTIRDDNNACATNAWDASLWLQSGPDISVEDLAAAGDELLAAWQ